MRALIRCEACAESAQNEEVNGLASPIQGREALRWCAERFGSERFPIGRAFVNEGLHAFEGCFVHHVARHGIFGIGIGRV
jgi:hypothetical protein